MQQCEQGRGISVYQHGVDVAYRYADLWRLIEGKDTQLEWPRLDRVELEYLALLHSQALRPSSISRYQIYHDCGKPFCREVDDRGRTHFPNHAEISAEVWKRLYPDDELGFDILRLDLHPHTAKGDDLALLMGHKLAPSLILTGWAAIYANAGLLFGGFESDSFKMKFKRLQKLTKQWCCNYVNLNV